VEEAVARERIDGEPAHAGQDLGLTGRQQLREVDAPRAQRVHALGTQGRLQEVDSIELDLRGLPVIGVAPQRELALGREALQPERPRTCGFQQLAAGVHAGAG
jgi:hypothetical protein